MHRTLTAVVEWEKLMGKLAITSASGKLGSAVVQAVTEIVGRDHVVGLARTPRKAESLGIEIRPGDYDSPEQLKKSLQGIDSVLLVSGMDAPEKRIGQHRNVIDAAKGSGVRKIVYTSIQGAEEGTAFSPIVQSNRQTEQDVQSSGLNWVIGRNGIYVEPDIQYIDEYRKRGEIANCAAEGLCGYTTRSELAFAYARILTQPQHDGRTYNLNGEPITQTDLANYLNLAFGTDLQYRAMSVADYRQDRVEELGDFLGNVIAGIYEGIREGAVNNESQFEPAAGRQHQGWNTYFRELAARSS